MSRAVSDTTKATDSARREVWYVAATDFPHGLGSTARARSICRALTIAGYDTRLLIPHALGLGRNQASAGETDGIRFEYLNKSTLRPPSALAVVWAKFRANLALVRRLVRPWRRPACAFVYNASLVDCWGLLVAGRLLGVPVVLDWTDEWIDPSTPIGELGVARYLFRRLAKATERLVHREVDRVVVVSRHLEHRMGRHRPKTIRCPVAFDPLEFAKAEPIRLAQPDEFEILYAGGVSRIEGVDLLVAAVGKLDRLPTRRLRLFIVGNAVHNETIQQYEQLATESCAPGLVTFLPAVDRGRYASMLRGADLLIIPRPTSVASTAGFPYKLVEDIASGAPVLVTRFGDVEEYFADGVHCLMCDPDAPDALAAGIRRAAEDLVGLAATADRGYARVTELFAYEAVAGVLGTLVEGLPTRKRDETPSIVAR